MEINWLDFVWYELTLEGISEQALSRGHSLVELSLTRLFNSHWHNASTVTGTIVQQSPAQLCNKDWHDSSTVAGTIIQESLARLFKSHWHDCSTVATTIVQQSLAWFFNSHWHNSSTATAIIYQQSLARFFNSGWDDSSTATVKVFFLFLCWQKPSAVMFTVEESCHAPGIRHMILIFPHNLLLAVRKWLLDSLAGLL